MRTRPAILLLLLAAATAAPAQLTVNDPNFAIDTVATGMNVDAHEMASDLHGNVYLLTHGGATSVVTQVKPDGTVVPNYASFVGVNVSQLATNPLNGLVYCATHSPVLPVILSDVWVLDPNAGVINIFTVDVVVRGFTIDLFGRYYFGGTGVQGNGLYRLLLSQIGPGINTTSFQGPGFGQNGKLQALVNAHVLIADQLEVRKWVEGTLGTAPYFFFPPLPNTIPTLHSLARSPFNQIGAGAFIGLDEFTTLCNCGAGFAFRGDLVAGSLANPFAQENYGGTTGGQQAICWGFRQSLYWYTNAPGVLPVIGRTLYRIRQLPAAGSPGSLVASQTATSITIDIHGRPGSNAPFLLGGDLAPHAPTVFQGPIDWIELFPFSTEYFPILDGVGLYGPPNPLARIGPGGVFSVTFNVSPTLPPLLLVDIQALILDQHAPSGLLYVTNVEQIGI